MSLNIESINISYYNYYYKLSLLNRKIIKLNNTFSKKKYPIVNLDYKNFKRREDIKIKFNE